MEGIEFKYYFHDEDGKECKEIFTDLKDNCLHDYEVCEKFLDFMRSIGFSEANVLNYFRE